MIYDIFSGVIWKIVGILIVALVMALPIMWLWNWLMPDIFGLIEIGFWQALGINIFSGILFRNNSNNTDK